jgi:hypothetical protein
MINLDENLYIKGAMTLTCIQKYNKNIILIGEYHTNNYQDCSKKQMTVIELYKELFKDKNNSEIFLEIPSYSNEEDIINFSSSLNVKEIYSYSKLNEIPIKQIDFRFDIIKVNLYNDNIMNMLLIEFVNLFYYSFDTIIEQITYNMDETSVIYTDFIKKIKNELKRVIYSFEYDIRNILYLNINNLEEITLKYYLSNSVNRVIINNKEYNFLQALRKLWCYIVDIKVISEIKQSDKSDLFIILGNNHVENLNEVFKDDIQFNRKMMNVQNIGNYKIKSCLLIKNTKSDIQEVEENYDHKIKESEIIEKHKKDKEYYYKNFYNLSKSNPFKLVQ